MDATMEALTVLKTEEQQQRYDELELRDMEMEEDAL